MLTLNTVLSYPLLLISSTTKRSFSALGKLAKVSGDTIKRNLSPAQISLNITRKIAQFIFKDLKALTLIIDDTLIRKPFSQFMVGACRFFDTKIGRKVMAYRLIAGAVTNGKIAIPICMGFMFAKEVLSKDDADKTKIDFIKEFYALTQSLFPGAGIKLALDGLFASIEFLTWCVQNNIDVTIRMHSNRKVICDGKELKIREIKSLIPRGRQMAKTTLATWHGLPLFITAERRIDKHGDESIVYIAATYKARPSVYVKNYKKRWPIEKFFRTSKQHLGLAECFSTSFEVQQNHVAAVMLAYSIAQVELFTQKFDTPEESIRAIKLKKIPIYLNRLARFHEIFGDIHA